MIINRHSKEKYDNDKCYNLKLSFAVKSKFNFALLNLSFKKKLKYFLFIYF